jgi:branched-chain amino acid transport system ATP-binding protein/neutral amino acid transport system ATP-binding protein
MSVLDVRDVVAGYGPTDEVLKGVNVRVDTNEIVGIIGPNGAGKSTLLKVIAGLVKPSRGEVTFVDQAITARLPREICRLGVAYVPQEQNIFPGMTVRENLEIGGFIDPQGARRRIDAAFRPFPGSREAPARRRSRAVGRRASGAGYGDGADGRPEGALAG